MIKIKYVCRTLIPALLAQLLLQFQHQANPVSTMGAGEHQNLMPNRTVRAVATPGLTSDDGTSK